MATIDLGKIKQVFRGTYNNATAYVPDDLVVFTDGSVTSTYICTTATTGNNPSSGGTAHANWAFVAKGQASSPTTTQGDLIVRGASADERLAIGAAGKVLKVNSSANGLEYGAGGGLVQTKSTHKSNTFVTNSTSYTDITGLNVNITPTSSSNKILVLVNISYGGHSNLYGFGRLVRTISGGSATAIGLGNADGNRTQAGFPLQNLDLANSVYHVKESSFMFLDSPNTTTSTEYQVQCMTHTGSQDVHINYPNNNDNSNYIGRFSSNIIAMEVTP
jgi:hypothetical protein